MRKAACAWRTTSPVTRVITSWNRRRGSGPRCPRRRPRDRAVDHVELAVVGAAELVLARVEPQPVGEVAEPGGREHVVDDDPRARRREAGEHLPRPLVRLGAEAVDDHAHRDAGRRLAREQRGERGPDLALAPAEHEDVHGRSGRLDVGEDPREELLALDPRLRGAAVDHANGSAASRRRARPSAAKASVAACAPVRRHRVGRRRPARAARPWRGPAGARPAERGRSAAAARPRRARPGAQRPRRLRFAARLSACWAFCSATLTFASV